MPIQFTFRHIAATQAIKDRVDKRVDKLRKFISYPVEFHALLSVEKGGNHHAEITCHAEHRDMVAEGKSKDLYESIDQAAHKLENQLKRGRERRKGHVSAHAATRPAWLRQGGDLMVEVPHREKRIRKVSGSSES